MKRLFAAAIAAFALARPSFADDVKRLSGADLAVQTHKWEGETIETTGHCFYADVDEYRCVVGGPGGAARIDFKTITPDAARQNLEDHCDTVEKLSSRACFVRFQFVYESFDLLAGSYGQLTTLVIPKDGAATIVGKK
ncbi:hypothetical protein [Rhodoblastus sp.]|uniref:hypothetical protein n=1 Tax=Rhodoblastus sp. TaxID=1962975 RepID=UPI003F9D00D7